MLRHRQRDRCDRHLEGDAVGLDATQYLVQIEPPVQPHARPGRCCSQQVEQTEDVGRGCRDLEPIVGAEAERVAPVPRGDSDRAMRVTYGLRQTRRARAEDEHGLVVLAGPFDRRAATPARQHGVAHGRVVEIGDPITTEPLRQQRGTIAVGDRVRGPRQFERMLDLECLPCGAERHRGRAGLADAVEGHHELRPIREHHGDAATSADTDRHEVMSERVGAAVELGKRESIVTEAHCRALAGLVGRPFEALVHHGAATRSRKTSFITLPVALSGSASTNSTTRGAL